MFSLDSDKTQCVALNVRLRQVLISSKNCVFFFLPKDVLMV